MSDLTNAIANLQEDLNSAQMMMESQDTSTKARSQAYAEDAVRRFNEKFGEGSATLRVELSRIRCSVSVGRTKTDLSARSFD